MKILSTCAAIILATSLALAGVHDGDTANGAPHGNVTVHVSGGIHGDYHVTFTDDVGTSHSTVGTPTMGGDAGEVEGTDWITVYGGEDEPNGGTYRIKNGKIQKKNKHGKAVNCGPAVRTDDEAVGTIP